MNIVDSPFYNINTIIDNANIHINSIEQETNLMNILKTIYKPIIVVNEEYLNTYLLYLSNSFYPFILITISCNDIDILNDVYYKELNKLLDNENLIVWFCSEKKSSHYKIRSYPIGPKRIDNSIMNYDAKDKMFNSIKEKLLYYDFTGNSNLDKFLSNNYTAVKSETMDNKSYLKCLEKYKFCVISPSKQQQHQVWEALLCGVIPIIESSKSNDLYINLPVVLIHNWLSITPEYLEDIYMEIIQYKNYDFEKLYKYYWLNDLLIYKNKEII